jgi:hypothetical protein
MPKIPTILSERDIYSGSTGPTANPSSFGPDMEGLAVGLNQTGRNIGQMANVAQAIEIKKKNSADQRWVTESVMQERMSLQEWMSDPANSESEDFSNKFKEYSMKRLQDYAAAAPSKEAADAFRSHMGDYVSRQYGNALQATEKTRINNTILGLDHSISDSLKSFRDAQSLPNNSAITDIQESFDILNDAVEKQFGDVSPTMAAKLKSHVAQQFVMGITPTHPDEAEQLLQSSTDIDESTRKTLLAGIKASRSSRDIVAEDQFNRTRRDHIANVSFGKTSEKIPQSVYELHYDKDKAAVLKAHDDEAIDTYNKANDFSKNHIGKNAGAQVAELEKFKEKATTDSDKNALQIMEQKAGDSLRLLKRDRVSWLTQNNPQVQVLEQQIESVTGGAERQALIEKKNNLMLQYQGNAPAGSSPEEASYYLNLPSHDRHLLSLGEAGHYAAQINKASPQEALKTINQLVGQYTDPDHQHIVFNDLVNVPEADKGLKQEYQLAFQNRDAWWVDTYIAALSDTKSVGQLDEATRKEVFDEIEKNPKFKQFQAALIGDNFDRAAEIQGFKQGLLTYTHALKLSGKPLKQAARSAVDMLIGETLGFANVNGQSLAITKDRPDKSSRRTDDEVRDLGRRLGVALQYIDPREVDATNFKGLTSIGAEGSVERLQALRDIVTSKGFFVTGNDGQSASLHVRDDNGIPFEIQDKNGKPFVIHFEDVPAFTSVSYSPTMGQGMYNPSTPMNPYVVKTEPRKTYNIKEGGGMWDKLMGNSARTNWPAKAPWIRHESRIPRFVPPTASMTPPPAEVPEGDLSENLIGTPPDDR